MAINLRIARGAKQTASPAGCPRAASPCVTTLDQIIDSADTRQRLGWNPKRTFTSSVPEQWAEWRATQNP